MSPLVISHGLILYHSRHLRSHSFYACSTCVVRYPDSQALRTHMKVSGHVQACPDRTCKRTKPNNTYFDAASCVHIRGADDQWRELFALAFGRLPPDALNTDSSLPPVDGMLLPCEAVLSNTTAQTAPIELRNESSVDYGLTPSFFDQAIDFSLPSDDLIPATPTETGQTNKKRRKNRTKIQMSTVSKKMHHTPTSKMFRSTFNQTGCI